MPYKKDAQENLIDDKGEKLVDKQGNFLKLDDNENVVNAKGEKVDSEGNIIQATEKAGKYKFEGLPEEMKAHLPADFDTLSQEKQAAALKKVAGKAKSADDKEKYIQDRNTEIGNLRKELDDFKKDKGGKPTKTELEVLLEGLKSKYDPEDLKDFQKISALIAEEKSKPIKNTLKSVLIDRLDDAIERDRNIDPDIYNENRKEVEKEYNRYRDPESLKEMRENLKEAALKVQKKVVAKLTEKEKETFEAKRKARLGAIPEVAEKGKSKDARTDEEKIRDSIIDAGTKKKEGIFG